MATSRKLPPLPSEIPSPLGPITVARVQDLKGEDGERLYGRFVWHKRLIEIDADLTGVAAWQTLRHEEVHARLSDAGLHEGIPHATIEALCDTIASARVNEMLAAREAAPRRKGKGKR